MRRPIRPLALVTALLLAACGGGDSGTGPTTPPPPPPPPVAIDVATENALPGTGEWSLSIAQAAATPADLAMYGAPYALNPGDSVHFFVHATTGPVRLQVFRLGWYGGKGGRLVAEQAGLPGVAQPACRPSSNGAVECPWSETLALPTTLGWTSGLYWAKAIDGAGRATVYPFVVRAPSDATPRLTAALSQGTWQAYNNFGGSSLYTYNGKASPSVSFRRPYYANGSAVLNASRNSDLAAVRFLERFGYPVNYISDLDLSRGSTPTPHVLLFTGHDEYWTTEMRNRAEALRDGGTHLVTLSSNNAYWHSRLSASPLSGRADEILTCYKSTNDPGATGPTDATYIFRAAPISRPESRLFGSEYVSIAKGTPSYTVASVDPASIGGGFLAAAGLTAGATVPGLSTLEGDGLDTPNSPTGLQVLLSAEFTPINSGTSAHTFTTTFYRAPSGAGVFATGSDQWLSALDGRNGTEVPALMTLTRSVLDWMLAH